MARSATTGAVLDWEKALLEVCDQNSKHVVDVGCGTGRLLCTIAKTFPHAHVTAFERETSMSAHAKEAAKLVGDRIRIVESDFMTTKLSITNTDVVSTLGFSLGGFFGVEILVRLAHRIKEILDPNTGYWCMDVCSELCGRYEKVLYSQANALGTVFFFKEGCNESTQSIVAQQYYNFKQFKNFLRSQGFLIVFENDVYDKRGPRKAFVLQQAR